MRRADGADIVLVGINYFPEATGIAPYTTAMAQSLLAEGIAVHVVTGVPHYPAWRLADDRYRTGRRWDEVVQGVPVTRVAHAIPPRAGLLGRAGMESSFFARARGAVAAVPARAVVAVTPSLGGLGAAVSAAAGRPVGAVVQDLTGVAASQSGTVGGAVGRSIGALEIGLLRRADVVGVITPRFGAVLAGQGVDADRIVDLANFSHVEGVDVDAATARARLGWRHDGLVVVHTGNMGMKQGLQSVVAAARLAEQRDARVDFVLVGDGNQRSAIAGLAAGCRRLHLVDPVSAEDYPYVLAAADILLLNERAGVLEMSLPSKLTSYVAAGRPIVAAVEPAGITAAALQEEAAAGMVEPGNPEALLGEVLRLGGDADRRTSLAAAARRLGERKYCRREAESRYVSFARRLLQEPEVTRS